MSFCDLYFKTKTFFKMQIRLIEDVWTMKMRNFKLQTSLRKDKLMIAGGGLLEN